MRFVTAQYRLFLALMVGVLLVACWLRVDGIGQYPPGVSNDEGVDVIDVYHIARTGILPFYEDLGRPEPLYLVIQAIATRLFGAGVWTLRVTTALIGILNIAAAYWAMTQVLCDVSPLPRRIAALTAAVALTIALGHITLSRAVYRAILQPLFMFLLIGFVLRGLRTERWRDFILAGLMLGLLLYTYTAAYLVPLAFLPLVIHLAVRQLIPARNQKMIVMAARRSWRWLPRLIVVAIIAGAMWSPVLLRYLTAPEAVIGRASDVSGVVFDPAHLPQIMLNLFIGEGDQNPQYNVGRAPLVPPVLQSVFGIGLLALMLRIRQSSSVFLLALALLCTVPVLLTPEIPHGLRIAGEYAVFPLVIGCAVASLFVVVENTVLARSVAVMIIGVFVGGVLLTQTMAAHTTYREYWNNPENYRQWDVFGKQLTHNEWFFRTDRRAFADWIKAQSYPILLPLDEVLNITTRAWLVRDFDPVGMRAGFVLPDDTHLVLPYSLALDGVTRATRQYVLLYDHEMIFLPPLSEKFHAQLMDLSVEGEVLTGGGGQLDLLGYSTTIPRDLGMEFEQRKDTMLFWGDELALTGWYGADNISQPGKYEFVLDWQAQRSPGHDYWSFIQILTQDYQRVAGSQDAGIYRWLFPTTQWRSTEDVPVRYSVDIPELAPGAYRLVTGVYPPFGERLKAGASVSELVYADGLAMVGWLKVPQMDVVVASDNAMVVDAVVGGVFRLSHIETIPSADGRLRVNLYWQVLQQRPDVDATVFVHLVDEADKIVAQSDIRPANGQYPTFIWDENEVVRTEHVLDVQDVSNLSVRVGMYVFVPELHNLSVVQDGMEKANSLVEFDALPE